MPPKKNLTKKKFFNRLKPFIKCAIKPIIKACKVNNYLLNFLYKYPYEDDEKCSYTSKFKRF